MRSGAICKAGIEIKGTWKGTDRRWEREREQGKRCDRWGSSEESDRSGFATRESWTFGEKSQELENDRKEGRDSRAMTGSSSANEEGSGKWKWDGENWWFRVDHRGPNNSRLRRKVCRAVETGCFNSG